MAVASVTRPRTALLVALLLLVPLLVTLDLMSSAVQNSTTLSRLFIPLLLFSVLGLAVLLVLVVANLVELVKQYRRRVPGARLTARLVVIFAALALPPVLVVHHYSTDFLRHGIESWFDVQIDEAMEQVLELSRSSLNLQLRDQLRATERLLPSLPDATDIPTLAVRVAELRRQSGATELTLLNPEGIVIVSSNVNPGVVVPEVPPDAVLQQVRDSGSYVGTMVYGEDGAPHVRAVAGERLARRFILHALFPASTHLQELGEHVQDAYVRYRELAYLRESLMFSFSLTLFLVLLFSFFAALWTAFYSARRLVAPIRDIAEGTRAVAEGDFDTQLPEPRIQDEMASLVGSFNAMTRRLAQARAATEASRRELEAQREYLETVLGRLSSGVMTIDDQQGLRTANPAARQILRVDLDRYLAGPFAALGQASPQLAQFVETLAAPLRNTSAEWREEITLYGGEGRQVLLCRISPLPAADGGHVLVFDDVTTLVKAQRDAAWGEVARRLAHEIKNPLTPIQLSAERLRRKFLKTMRGDDASVLDRATHTIVQQVEAMKEMVNAFSDYAKPSQLHRSPLDINQLVADVMELYRAAPGAVAVSVDLGAAGARVEADPTRLRQVLHNLVKNALEAVADRPAGEVLVRTAVIANDECPLAEIQVLDNGGGFDEANLGQIFEPYVTTKTRGTGLGLAIVKKIVEEHGGIIWAANRPEGGGGMTLRLPICGLAAAAPSPPAPQPTPEERARHDRALRSGSR
jgi:nitrogen fixation/metabolism regulation signal transduction histidine kinase